MNGLDVRIVLVGNEGGENLGLIARSMMNMDSSRLYLVSPKVKPDSKKALMFSVHASSILQNVTILQSMQEFRQQIRNEPGLVAAMTRRDGQWRKKDFRIDELPQFVRSMNDSGIKIVYLVFGREQNGLTNEEIRECDAACFIPSSDKYPSYNLASAVTVSLYEFYRDKILFHHEENTVSHPVASIEEYDSLHSQIVDTLEFLGFFKRVPEWRLSAFIRKILYRARLDSEETNIIRQVFFKIKNIVMRKRNEQEK